MSTDDKKSDEGWRQNGEVPVPEHVPPEFRTAYKEFAISLLVQRLLVVNKLSVAQAQKILFFLATKLSEQLTEPESVITLGQTLIQSYQETTQQYANHLAVDPARRVRASVMDPVARRIHIAQDRNRPVEVNITPEAFGFSIGGDAPGSKT